MNFEPTTVHASEVETVSSLSLSGRIVRWIKEQRYVNGDHAWVNGGEFERLALLAGYVGSNARRRLRELYADGVIDRRLNPKGHAEYKYLRDL